MTNAGSMAALICARRMLPVMLVCRLVPSIGGLAGHRRTRWIRQPDGSNMRTTRTRSLHLRCLSDCGGRRRLVPSIDPLK
jgi:hypothetical protein